MKKKIFFIIIGLVLAGVVAAIYEWNKPRRKAEDEKGIAITAPALFQEYSSNEQVANQKYLNKILVVSGKVSAVDTNQEGGIVVILASDDPLNGIACTMRDKGAHITLGSDARVKGFCSGLVTDVKLTDCIITP